MTRPASAPPTSWRWHAGALLFYAALSILILDHFASLSTHILGTGSDPYLFIWFLAWWPYAISQHLDPLYTHMVWQPAGLHLAWTTCIPFLAILAVPVTTLFGPVAAYNMLTLMAPVLSALACYALCLRVTNNPLAALIGGYLFGFSTYEMAEAQEHLNLDFNAAVPLIALVIVNRWQGRIGRFTTVAFAAILLAIEFYISAEVFATAIFFSACAWVLAICLLPEQRAVLMRMLRDAAYAGPVTLLLVAPLLWPMLAQPRDVQIPAGWVFVSSAHLLNLLTPSADTVLALISGRTSYNFFGLIPQYDFAAGLPLLLILFLYARANWRDKTPRFTISLLLLILLASLGPQLWFGDIYTAVIMPWRAMLPLPLISAALPVRFALYSTLILAVIAALWLAQNQSLKTRLIAGIACLFLLPSLHPVGSLPEAGLYTSGAIQQIIGPDARVLILPATYGDPSTFWQAENHFGFSQVQGYLGFPPHKMQIYPAVSDIMFRARSNNLSGDLRQFCAATGTHFIIAGGQTPGDMLQAVLNLKWPMTQRGDTRIFTVPAVDIK